MRFSWRLEWRVRFVVKNAANLVCQRVVGVRLSNESNL